MNSVLLGNMADGMWTTVADSFRITSIGITKLDGSPDGVLFPVAPGTPFTSGSAGTDFIPQASALVKLSTGGGGRSGRGRVYLPALGEGAQTSGTITAAKQLLTTTEWYDFWQDMLAAPAELGVASYKNSSFRPLTDVFCESLSATQRKRQRR